MILTRQERERLVLDLYYNQGKNTHEISQVGMSFRDIGAILKKA
jgi:DNA-directed RNA polymerase specialized sigma subunit